MLIHELILNNFRVYAGEHRFDLRPDKQAGRSRPIVLFGGLNGAGKTSILNAVRLVLYGKAALGGSVSQRRYDQYLMDSIHRSRETHRTASTATVEIKFSYAKLGVKSEFHIVRIWERKGKGVHETLRIEENGAEIKGLDYEQAQHFLNELIPIGVSELFFFDGEKISQLADDAGGAGLESSIKKLLGLDVVERLAGDLTVLSRNIAKGSSQRSIEEEITEVQASLQECRFRIENLRQEISGILIRKSEAAATAERLTKNISDRGGHFSTSRAELHSKLDELTDERDFLISRISALISDCAPMAICSDFCERVEHQVQKDLNESADRKSFELLEKNLLTIKARLEQKIPGDVQALIEAEVNSLLNEAKPLSNGEEALIHDLTASQAGKILSTFESGRSQGQDASKYFEELERVEVAIDEIGASLTRAPDDILIQSDFENLQEIKQTIGKFEGHIESLKADARKQAQTAVECARRLDKLFDEAAKHSDQQRVLSYISNANGMLEEFVDRSATDKIRDLEVQFTECFAKLARKDDLALTVSIDPKSFHVALRNAGGREVGRDELSAGEKQIFAISMLEALAKTSGRQLPMIVDTPLGRLDSKHRTKLVEGYFPLASHQMIILSTDTEVDESFYSQLEPDISRAFRLDYDPHQGATKVETGYFWQKTNHKGVGSYVPDTLTTE
ncbi:DNA sulfur modification protein DndD [Marinobacter antarcticus]|uniref:DNA sulfur modification protein DndD n=1 Tax=Marinobacter antarcticus TaxID=564117 RepID=A0A1M6U7U3_9GAMM|nr:DNA sulfur modification protein DndD [Marinobacter antarcticus]SHK65241.1 DNA sulfur modification protein DndD [Marinobacter antarcticus]